MKNTAIRVKKQLEAAINQLCQVSWMFSKSPGHDFTRNRKLSFRQMIILLLAMEGGSLTTELLKYFGCSAEIASSSAFVQQRGKISAEAMASLFSLFVSKTDLQKRYKGLRLIAADGSDIPISANPNHKESYFPGANGQAHYNLLHLDAMYDLLQQTYLDATLCGKREENERRAACSMVDRSPVEDALFIGDRGFENYNLMAHIQEKGWSFLIRIKDSHTGPCISAGLDLPETDTFDLFVDLALTRKMTKETKPLFKNRNRFRFLPATSTFDFLPKDDLKNQPVSFYSLPFRIVRFMLPNGSYETVVTNLDPFRFPSSALQELYFMRWGIESSFRKLKYPIGLLHFHAKKVEHIVQEVFARLIMYNFTELITSHVVISNANKKDAYKVNFSAAVHVCKRFFLGNVSPPALEALFLRLISPIRPGRSSPRRTTVKHSVSFVYRVS